MERLARIGKLVCVIDTKAMTPVGAGASIVPGLVIRHYRIERGRAHRPRQGICDAKTESVRKAALQGRLERVVVSVADKVMQVNGVESRIYGAQKDIGERLTAIS